MLSTRRLILVAAACWAGAAVAQGPSDRAPAGDISSVTILRDQIYAEPEGHSLGFDLYTPNGVANPPLLIWVHGGGWARGSRYPVSTVALVNAGYAMASVSYRLSGDAPYPAQVHDLKAAVRFLRANAGRYGFDASRIGIIGVSAGAHLAALVGVTNGSAEHEGAAGGTAGETGGATAAPAADSDVQAIVSYFGASNLTSILDQSTPFGLNIRVPGLTALFDGPVEERQALARSASPVFHVDSDDPPLLLLHGDQDPQMPINQSHELHGAYEAAGLDVAFEVVHGAAHGGAAFFDEARTELVVDFLNRQLRANAH